MENQENPKKPMNHELNFNNDFMMKIRMGQLHAPGQKQASSNILSSIKPLPSDLLKNFDTFSKEKKENKTPLPFNSTQIKSGENLQVKAKEEKWFEIDEKTIEGLTKIRFPKEKIKQLDYFKNKKFSKGDFVNNLKNLKFNEKEINEILTCAERPLKGNISPIQMSTTLSGQYLKYQQSPSRQELAEVSQDGNSSSESEKQNTNSMSCLRYITVSVKCRRLIYEKEIIYNIVDKTEELLNIQDDGGEFKNNLESYRTLLADEIEILNNKILPFNENENYKKAKKILFNGLQSFREIMEDLILAVESKDKNIVLDARANLEEAFENMNEYFIVRDKIKESMIN